MRDLNKGVKAGALGGAVWGFFTFTISFVFGVSVLEGPLLKDFVTFLVGGMVFGVITGGMFAAVQAKIPVASSIVKGVIVALAVWGILLSGSAGLSMLSPERYNIHIIEMVRGVILVAVLGGIVGFLGGRRA